MSNILRGEYPSSSNMLIQSKTARDMLNEAQQRITSIANIITDERAKEAFNAYLEENKGNGGINDTSKIIRSLNTMKDPNFFFKSVKDFDSVKIADDKGETVLLTDRTGKTHQVNPNHRTVYTDETREGFPTVKKSGKLTKCLGEDYKEHRHLGKLNERQTGRLEQVFGGAAGYNKDIVDYAAKLADKMKITKDPDAFMSLVEVVVAHTVKNNFNLSEMNSFHADVVKDLTAVREIAAQQSVKFADDYKALYHYRKHGGEVMKCCTPKYYLDDLPTYIQNNGMLANVCNVTAIHQNGSTEVFTEKTYFLNDSFMLVMIEKNGVKTISTLYKKQKNFDNYMQRFLVTNVPPPDVAFNGHAAVAGLDEVQL